MKKIINDIFSFALAVLLVFLLCSCGNMKEEPKYELIFSEYYQSATEYSEIKPLLQEFFSIVYSAYSQSNKENLSTFHLPDRYYTVSESLHTYNESTNLSDILNADDKEKIAYLKKLELLEPYLRVETKIAAYNLLTTVGNSKNEEWFNELNQLLLETAEVYRNSGKWES